MRRRGSSERPSTSRSISQRAPRCRQVRRRPTEHGGEAVRRDWVRRVLREGGRTPIERLHTWTKVEEIRRLGSRSEEHTSELQSLTNVVCRLLLEKKNNWLCPPG